MPQAPRTRVTARLDTKHRDKNVAQTSLECSNFEAAQGVKARPVQCEPLEVGIGLELSQPQTLCTIALRIRYARGNRNRNKPFLPPPSEGAFIETPKTHACLCKLALFLHVKKSSERRSWVHQAGRRGRRGCNRRRFFDLQFFNSAILGDIVRILAFMRDTVILNEVGQT